MKSLLALAIVAGVSFAADVAPAKADPYKWCAMYGGNAIDGATFLDQERSSFDRIASDVARSVVTSIVEAF